MEKMSEATGHLLYELYWSEWLLETKPELLELDLNLTENLEWFEILYAHLIWLSLAWKGVNVQKKDVPGLMGYVVATKRLDANKCFENLCNL